MSNNLISAFERGYTNLIRRDLCYFAGGNVFIIAVIYVAKQDISYIFSSEVSRWYILFWVILSYFIGIIFHDSIVIFKLANKLLGTNTNIHDNFGDYISKMGIIKRKNEQAYIEYQRIVFFKEVGSKLGWPFIVGFIISLIPYFINPSEYNIISNICISSLYFILSLCCIRINRYYRILEAKCYNELVDKYVSPKK